MCDGAFFKGNDLAVIGGGDSAFQEGLFLTRFAKKLHVVHRRSDFRAQAVLQDRLLAKDMVHTVTPATVKEIGGDGTAVQWLDVARDGEVERIPVEGVFVFVGFKPVGKHLFEGHIDHDENGYLITDQYMQTSIPGVYAAGDTRAQLAKQITTAVGDATTAVLHAERYIEELKHAEIAFPQAPREVVAQTATRMKVLTFAPGAVVIREGEPSDRFFVVAKGEAVAVQRDAGGAERVLGTLRPGDYFGEVGILSGHPRNATVRAKTSLEVLALDEDAFRTLVGELPGDERSGESHREVAQPRRGRRRRLGCEGRRELFHVRDEVIQVERLLQHVADPALAELRRVLARHGGLEHHGHAAQALILLYPVVELETAHPGKADIEHQKIRLHLLERL